jgi:hypothetical protein
MEAYYEMEMTMAGPPCIGFNDRAVQMVSKQMKACLHRVDEDRVEQPAT